MYIYMYMYMIVLLKLLCENQSQDLSHFYTSYMYTIMSCKYSKSLCAHNT